MVKADTTAAIGFGKHPRARSGAIPPCWSSVLVQQDVQTVSRSCRRVHPCSVLTSVSALSWVWAVSNDSSNSCAVRVGCRLPYHARLPVGDQRFGRCGCAERSVAVTTMHIETRLGKLAASCGGFRGSWFSRGFQWSRIESSRTRDKECRNRAEPDSGGQYDEPSRVPGFQRHSQG